MTFVSLVEIFDVSRSYSSTAITTTTGRSYLVTATGAALARSISSPKLFFASADVMERNVVSLRGPSVGRIRQQRNGRIVPRGGIQVGGLRVEAVPSQLSVGASGDLAQH